MKNIITILFLGMFISVCSITELEFLLVKKCVEEGDKIVYSYIWVYDKEVGVYLTKKLVKN